MAPIQEAYPAQTSLQALVELDKSAEGFVEQIAKAFKIAGIPLKDSWSLLREFTSNPQPEQIVSFSAREEWVLRWLLNRLQSLEEVGSSARADPRSWLLLVRLLQRIPLANAARLLNSFKFMGILAQTSSDITGSIQPPSINLKIPDTSSRAGSVVSTSEDKEYSFNISRKRKRSSSAEGEVQTLSASAAQRKDLSILLLSIQEAVQCIASASATSSDQSLGFGREHMKSVLRSDPKTAANILGTYLDLASLVREGLDHHSLSFQEGRSWVATLINIWNNRSISVKDAHEITSHAAFSSQCLLPAASLLIQYRSSKEQNAATKNTIRILERLIARHIFVPARSSFFNTTGNTKPSSVAVIQRTESQSLDNMLQPLQDLAKIDLSAKTHWLTEGPSQDATMVMSCLLDIAIRCSPRGSPRKRLTERPWLQALFLGFANYIGLSDLSTPDKHLSSHYVATLEGMLDVLINREVSIGTDELRDIIRQYSGLLQGSVNWRLLAKVVKIDVNVFLLHAKSEGEPDLLGLLLSTITTTITRTTRYGDFPDDYELVKTQIIQPLMVAFARARDMMSFIVHWRRELTKFEEILGAANVKSRHTLSVWQDEYLILKFRDHLESSLTGQQVLQALVSTRSQLQDLVKKGLPKEPGIIATLIVLDAFVGAVALEETVDLLQEEIQYVHSAVSTALIITPYGSAQRWHMWRILARIHDHVPWTKFWDIHHEYKGDSAGNAVKDVSIEAKMTIERAVKSAEYDIVDGNYAAEASEALHYLLAFQDDMTRTLMSDSVAAASRMLLKRVPPPWESEGSLLTSDWDGNPDNIPLSFSSRLVIPIAVLIFRYRKILSCLTSDVRLSLFRAFHWAAYSEEYSKGSQRSSARTQLMARVWQALLKDDYMLNNMALKDDILATIQVGLIQNEGGGNKLGHHFNEFQDFCIKEYLSLPQAIIHRRHRQETLDILSGQLQYVSYMTPSPAQMTSFVALLARLMENPCPSSKLSTDPKLLWAIADNIECPMSSPYGEMTLASFETLVTTVLTRAVGSINENENSHQFLRSFQEQLQARVGIDDGNTPFLENHTVLRLVKASMVVFWSHKDTMATLGPGIDMAQLRHLYLKRLLTKISLVDQILLPSFELTLDAITAFSNNWGEMHEQIRSAVEGISNKLMAKWTGIRSDMDAPEPDEQCIKPSLMVLVYKIVAEDPILRPIHQHLAVSLLNNGIQSGPQCDRSLTSEQRRFVLRSFMKSLRSLNSNEKLSQLSKLEREAGNTSCLQLLGALVMTMNREADTQHGPSRVGLSLSAVFVKLLNRLPNASRTEHFSLITGILELVMRDKSWAVTQYGIDEALKVISTCCSRAGPRFEGHSSSLFLQLTGLMNTILTLHRKKILGRSHLVITVINGLLRCLFIPLGQKSSKTNDIAANRPRWLEKEEARLGAKEATAYSRLLTTLCDPTVSSVTDSRHRSKNGFTDETKKAKAMAGECLRIVLMEYTEYQLCCRMLPEVKAALMPGLYAVLDVTEADLMRMLNRAMPLSNWAILKDLYGDYKRFGKWSEQ